MTGVQTCALPISLSAWPGLMVCSSRVDSQRGRCTEPGRWLSVLERAGEPEARGRPGAGSGQQRTAAHAPFPAASSSTAATLGSFLYANRPCQKRSRDPPRGGAARPAPRGEGAGAGAERELAPRSPPARTWLTPRAALISALTCPGRRAAPTPAHAPLRLLSPSSNCDPKRSVVHPETQSAFCSLP